MRSESRSQFVEVAIPAFNAFIWGCESREVGLRKDTINAAAVAQALLDLPEFVYLEIGAGALGHQSDRAYRESFWPRCREYEIVCDLGIAWKHNHVSRQGRTIKSRVDLKEHYTVTRYEDTRGYYYVTGKAITVDFVDGLTTLVGPLLSESMNQWAVELHRLGILPVLPTFPMMHWRHYTRDQASALGPIRLMVQKGEEASMHRLQFVFETQTGACEPANFNCEFDVVVETTESPIGA